MQMQNVLRRPRRRGGRETYHLEPCMGQARPGRAKAFRPVRALNSISNIATLVQYAFYKMCKILRDMLVNVVHSKKWC